MTRWMIKLQITLNNGTAMKPYYYGDRLYKTRDRAVAATNKGWLKEDIDNNVFSLVQIVEVEIKEVN